MKYQPKCHQCDSAIIQGVYCHEFGCPNWNKVWNDEEEMWVNDWFDDDEELFYDEDEYFVDEE